MEQCTYTYLVPPQVQWNNAAEIEIHIWSSIVKYIMFWACNCNNENLLLATLMQVHKCHALVAYCFDLNSLSVISESYRNGDFDYIILVKNSTAYH